MKLGMLWFDDDKQRSLVAKVQRATLYYEKKYGVEPNCCYIHPSAMNGIEQVNGVVLRARQATQKDNFWIGVEN